MNLKHFYYRTYFGEGITLSQPPQKSDERKKIEVKNEKAFRGKNAILTSTKNVKGFQSTGIKSINGVQEIKLQVQNPGLLPGIGYPHEVGYPGELKLGFGFDHVTGLPVLPGSSVKGVLRSVFPQCKFDKENPSAIPKADSLQIEKVAYIFGLLKKLDQTLTGNTQEQIALVHRLEQSVFCGWNFSNPDQPLSAPMHKHDAFFDAQPVSFNTDQLLGRDALTPHGDNPLKNPIPLPFLKVMPEVTFGFYFRLQDTQIGNIRITAEQKRRLFAEVLCTVGAGAKTNVGYGQFFAPNAADRLMDQNPPVIAEPNLGNQTLAPTAPVRTSRIPFNKSLAGKKAQGEVVSATGENPVRFKILNVEGFDGERQVRVPDSLAGRFITGKRFELTVYKANPDKMELEIKVENFNPLP